MRLEGEKETKMTGELKSDSEEDVTTHSIKIQYRDEGQVQ